MDCAKTLLAYARANTGWASDELWLRGRFMVAACRRATRSCPGWGVSDKGAAALAHV